MALRLTTRLTLAAAAIAVLPLVCAGVSIGWLVRRELWRQRDAALVSRAQAFAERVQSTVLDPLARDTALRRWAERRELLRTGCTDALANLRAGRMIAAAAVLGPDGNIRCASTGAISSRYASSSAREQRWFQAALEGNLAAAGVWSAEGEQLLDVAVGLPRGAGVVVGAHRLAAMAAMIDDAAKAQPGLAVVAGETLVYGELPGDLVRALREKTGATEESDVVAGWIRNDVAPTDLGGDWIYVATLPRAAAHAAVDSFIWLIAFLIVGAALFAAVSAWFLGSRLTLPLRELGDAVEGIVQQGDLTRTLEVHGDDEIARVARAFSAMVVKLREIPALLLESTRALERTVAELGAVAAQQRETVARQAEAVGGAKTVSDAIRESSRIARQRAREVEGNIARTGEVGRAGEDALARTLAVLTGSRDEVARIADQMGSLREAALRIKGITDAVKDLADQSNMLALNAAIEAVRSGDAGKGFSVVAREIRSLADQSIEATGNVREILAGVTQAIGAATSVAENGSKRVGESLADIRASSEGLRELATLSVKGADGMRDLVGAVAEQDQGIVQVGTSLGGLDDAMNETQQGIAAISDAVRALDEVARQISGLVGRFRV